MRYLLELAVLACGVLLVLFVSYIITDAIMSMSGLRSEGRWFILLLFGDFIALLLACGIVLDKFKLYEYFTKRRPL